MWGLFLKSQKTFYSQTYMCIYLPLQTFYSQTYMCIYLPLQTFYSQTYMCIYLPLQTLHTLKLHLNLHLSSLAPNSNWSAILLICLFCLFHWCLQPKNIYMYMQWFILKIVWMGTVYPSDNNQWVRTQIQWVKNCTGIWNFVCSTSDRPCPLGKLQTAAWQTSQNVIKHISHFRLFWKCCQSELWNT